MYIHTAEEAVALISAAVIKLPDRLRVGVACMASLNVAVTTTLSEGPRVSSVSESVKVTVGAVLSK